MLTIVLSLDETRTATQALLEDLVMTLTNHDVEVTVGGYPGYDDEFRQRDTARGVLNLPAELDDGTLLLSLHALSDIEGRRTFYAKGATIAASFPAD